MPSIEVGENQLVIPQIWDQTSTLVDVSHGPTLDKIFESLHSTGKKKDFIFKIGTH